VKKFWWVVVVVVMCIAGLEGCSSSSGGAPAANPAAVASDVPQQTEPEQPADEEMANTLKWTTASEVDNFGFDIYRALSEDGPFDRLTTEPLAGAGTTDEPQKYVFVDEEIDPSRDYFYYIESISLGGIRETFSPIIKAPAKRPVKTLN